MSAHTPGPWRVTGANVRAGAALVAIVTDHWADEPTPDDEKASTARLIAAAPALLEALQNCANVLALALPLFDDESTDGKDSRDEVESVIDAARAAIERAAGGAP